MKKSREEMKQELIALIRFNRERVPEDILAKAQRLAQEQMQQQTSQQTPQEARPPAPVADVSPQLSADKTMIPYDKKAAKEIIEIFFTKFDKEGDFLKKLKEKMLSQTH